MLVRRVTHTLGIVVLHPLVCFRALERERLSPKSAERRGGRGLWKRSSRNRAK